MISAQCHYIFYAIYILLFFLSGTLYYFYDSFSMLMLLLTLLIANYMLMHTTKNRSIIQTASTNILILYS